MNTKRLYWFTTVVVFVVVIIIGGINFSELRNIVKIDETTINSMEVKYVNLNGGVRKFVGQREMNYVLKLNNSHLIFPEKEMQNEEIKIYADEVIQYADFCESQGTPFLFVQPISDIDENNKQLPAGAEDYSNENINVFLQYLREAGIEVLDIRECMKKDGMDLYDYTYITDHHWTTEGCFYAFSHITDWIEKETGVTVNSNVTNLENYEIETYKNWYLGSYGLRTGEIFSGVDDYELIIPTFDVEFVDKEGKSHLFYEQVVNSSVFEKSDAARIYVYEEALDVPDGVATTSQYLSVLLVSDSYSIPMAPYLKLAYSDYDFQHYEDGFSADYVLQTNPDVVVMMPYIISTFCDGAVFHDMIEK